MRSCHPDLENEEVEVSQGGGKVVQHPFTDNQLAQMGGSPQSLMNRNRAKLA